MHDIRLKCEHKMRAFMLCFKIIYLLLFKVTMFVNVFVGKANSSYSSQCRKLKISMSNGNKIPHMKKYFMCLRAIFNILEPQSAINDPLTCH